MYDIDGKGGPVGTLPSPLQLHATGWPTSCPVNTR